MGKLKVVISDFDYGDINIETEVLKSRFGDRVDVIGLNAKSEDELIDAAIDADAIITQYAKVGRKTIEKLERCKVIARYGTGVDIVDVEAATKKGIMVTNVPDYCFNEVADHAVAMLLLLIRKIKIYDRNVRTGEWRWQSSGGIHRIQGKTLGLVGFGRIGKAIARRMESFGVRIIVYTPSITEEKALRYGVEAVEFQQLLKESDFIIIQAPLSEKTRHMFNDEAFSIMKEGVFLVNTARGPIVESAALIKALKSGKVVGAGLDDIEEEPAKLKEWEPTSELFHYDNVIVTPHAAYYSEESIRESRERAAKEVARVLKGEFPLHLVNSELN